LKLSCRSIYFTRPGAEAIQPQNLDPKLLLMLLFPLQSEHFHL
jgi:hypothetical protein